MMFFQVIAQLQLLLTAIPMLTACGLMAPVQMPARRTMIGIHAGRHFIVVVLGRNLNHRSHGRSASNARNRNEISPDTQEKCVLAQWTLGSGCRPHSPLINKLRPRGP